MLQKGKVNINFFNPFNRQKKRSKKLDSSTDNNDNKKDYKNNNKNNDINSSKIDLKVPTPSLKDMEFSWSENF